MLEIIAIFGALRLQGWRPLRTIVFASWDAQEYNMMGSTEWVEDHIEELRHSGVAYLNVDVGVTGSEFKASASPLLQRALLRVLDRVSDPVANKTLREIWDANNSSLGGFGGGGDFVPFQDLAGTSSIDFGFDAADYPKHSCHETREWMESYVDPGLRYHHTLAQVWVLLTLEISQNLLLPYGLGDYAQTLDTQIKILQGKAEALGAPVGNGFDLAPLLDSIHHLNMAAQQREDWEIWWFGQVFGSGSLETNGLAQMRRKHNHKITDFETNLLDLHGHDPQHHNGDPHGVPGREQFKHVIFGPQRWSGQDDGWFPFINDALEDKDWEQAQKMVEKTSRIIMRAHDKVMAE